ncbi:HtaA domain-containing protein [Promicromonospora sp. Populi]|uniref:HtaA domain-containing protein n=1 Tax=Promicromonospora sp. Populi TaxID=3239420 RepID=UPI0034E284C4
MAHLDWEIKASLLMYVMGAPGGRIVQDDAVGGTGAAFHFPLDPERSPEPSADSSRFAFTGSVVFIGHYGSFVGEVADIEVDSPADGGSDWTMSIRDRESDVRTVAFRLTGSPERSADGLRLTWRQVELTDDGAKLWGGSYSAGTPFEPVTIDLS